MSKTVRWRKSSYSGTQEGDCVELADLGPVVGIRDSKSPGMPHLSVSRSALADLLGRVRSDSLNMR